MNINKLFPSKYLKADDLNGKPYTLTIRQMRVEQLGHGKEQETKPILYFEGAEKGLVLNRTNAMIIASLYTPETDNWSGQRITLYATRVKAFGEMHDAIRVKQERPAQPVRQEPTPAMQAAVIDDADDVLDYEEDAPLPTRTAEETFGDAAWYAEAKAKLSNGVATFAGKCMEYHRDGGQASQAQYQYLVGLLDSIVKQATGADDGHKRVLAVLCQGDISKDNPPSKTLATRLLDKLATHKKIDGEKVPNPEYDQAVVDACVTIYRAAESVATPSLFEPAGPDIGDGNGVPFMHA